MSSMTDTIWRVLEAVGRKRERGITQVELHQELNIGAQPVFHIIKQLSTRGLVKKVNLVFQKNNTNLCLHTIFAH
ncbi:B-block binding subunit of TFIIIC [Syncephalis plumigaleata]|nr:B-block binding subunit of TFIIIC [Syncephalis plumigaleata]